MQIFWQINKQNEFFVGSTKMQVGLVAWLDGNLLQCFKGYFSSG